MLNHIRKSKVNYQILAERSLEPSFANEILTKNIFFLMLTLTAHLPGFMTSGLGVTPWLPATVTNVGVLVGLNNTSNFCSMSLGLSGVILITPVTGSGLGLTYERTIRYTDGFCMYTSWRISFCSGEKMA